MDFESMFGNTKWEILTALSQKKQSPLELATKLNTTIANISQQLRLLEAAGLVKTEKTRSAEKGKPRILYSIARDFVFVISLQEGGAGKRLINADTHHSIISRIWQIKNSDIHYEVEKAFWKIESMMDDITAMAFDEISNTLHIESKKEKKVEDVKIKIKFQQEIKDSSLLLIYKRTEVVVK